jgi:ferredoxin-type protein NapG
MENEQHRPTTAETNDHSTADVQNDATASDGTPKAEDSATSMNSNPANTSPGISRRTLCFGIGGAALMLALGGLKSAVPQSIIRPPGGQDEDHLISACIRCEKCYEICPENIITPAHIEDGIANTRTPTLNFSSGWCNWCAEENDGHPLCAQACPTQALKLPEGATTENTIIGKAVIVTDWCLAYKLIGCRFCYDACPYEAIRLDSNNRPVVITESCNGCGACEAVCVSLSEGSISEGATSRAITIRPVDEVQG